MKFLILYFLITDGGTVSGGGLEIYKIQMSCGMEGVVVGVQVNYPVNPTRLLVPDPGIPSQHCEIDIMNHVIGLIPGEYHIATAIHTEDVIVPYIQHDPHTSPLWMRVAALGNMPKKPGTIEIRKP